MKILCRGTKISLALFVSLSFVFLQSLYAADLNSQDVAQKIVRQDDGIKAQIKDVKHKIAEERNGIIAAGRRLSQAKKTRDKALVEQVKKEVDAEIKDRKEAISVLKTDIERLQGSVESLAPSSRGALER